MIAPTIDAPFTIDTGALVSIYEEIRHEVMRFVDEIRAKDASVTASALVPLVKERFGLAVHPRSVERALARQEKKRL